MVLSLLIEIDNRVDESQILCGITYSRCDYVTPESKNIVSIKSNATSKSSRLSISIGLLLISRMITTASLFFVGGSGTSGVPL